MLFVSFNGASGCSKYGTGNGATIPGGSAAKQGGHREKVTANSTGTTNCRAPTLIIEVMSGGTMLLVVHDEDVGRCKEKAQASDTSAIAIAILNR
jgi:hypothetical protein